MFVHRGSLFRRLGKCRARHGWVALGSDGADHLDDESAGCVCFGTHVVEASGAAVRREGLGVLVGPAVTGQPGGARAHPTLDHKEIDVVIDTISPSAQSQSRTRSSGKSSIAVTKRNAET